MSPVTSEDIAQSIVVLLFDSTPLSSVVDPELAILPNATSHSHILKPVVISVTVVSGVSLLILILLTIMVLKIKCLKKKESMNKDCDSNDNQCEVIYETCDMAECSSIVNTIKDEGKNTTFFSDCISRPTVTVESNTYYKNENSNIYSSVYDDVNSEANVAYGVLSNTKDKISVVGYINSFMW